MPGFSAFSSPKKLAFLRAREFLALKTARYPGANHPRSDAKDRALTSRVMDFLRFTEDKMAENRVLLDDTHLMAQIGVDLITRSNAMSA